MSNRILSGVITTLIILTSCCRTAAVQEDNRPMAAVPEFTITAPPDTLGLDPFYSKYVNVNGIHVTSSWRVPDSAFVAVYRTLHYMTEALPPEVLKAMTDIDTRVTVMARYEGTTDVPENHDLINDTTLNWDVRARGLGGERDFPLTSCAEENVLGYQIDKYHAEDILIHEFAHSIHLIGIVYVHPDINERLQKALDEAMAAGKYRNTYAATDIAEYWAEGVQDWFNVNAEMPAPDGKHNQLNTREELKKYDPALYSIIAEFFPEMDERISCHKKVDLYHI